MMSDSGKNQAVLQESVFDFVISDCFFLGQSGTLHIAVFCLRTGESFLICVCV